MEVKLKMKKMKIFLVPNPKKTGPAWMAQGLWAGARGDGAL